MDCFAGFETDIENNHLLAAVSDNSKIKLSLTPYEELKDFEAKASGESQPWSHVLVAGDVVHCSAGNRHWMSCSSRSALALTSSISSC